MNPFFKRLALAAGAVVLVAAAVLYVIHSTAVHAVHPPVALAALKPEKPAAVPAVAFADAAGKQQTLAAFRGRYVLLNMWATWCGPCVKELPALAKLEGTSGGNFVVVPVNVGRSTEAETKAFLAAHGAAALGVYVDHNLALMRAMHVYGLPVTVLIDPQGREVARADGPAEWDSSDAIAYFKSLTARAPS